MPTQVQFRRGNTIQNDNFTGAAGEITVNTDDYSIRVHDGSTQGGFDVAEYSNAKVASYLGQLNTNVIPAADNVYSLGSPSNKFSELWLSGNSIFLGNIILKEEGDGLKVVVGETEVFSANASSGVESVAGQTGSISNAQIAASLIDQNVSVKDFTVDGNLYVIGTTTNVTSVSVVIDDKNILLGNGATSAGQVDQGGITLAYVNAHLVYDEPADSWEFNRNLLIHGFQALTLANTTSDLNEGTNLYYTDSRVYSNVVSLGYYNKANIADLNTSNVLEGTNLYFTNARTYANVVELGFYTKANIADLNTDNVTEGSKLFFTDDRVYSNVISLGYYDKANIADLTTSNVAEETNLYFTDDRVYSNVVTLGFYNKANIADLNTSNIAEGTNLFFTDDRVYSNVVTLGYYNKANIADLTTANVSEVTNLYYTDARARDALSQGNGITFNKSTGVITANVTSVVGVVGAVSNAQIVAGIQEQNYLKNVGLTTSNTNQQVYHNFASATYRSGEYLIQMTSGTDYHVTKILVAHNGSSAFVTQYGDLFTNASLGSFDADISGSDVRILITPANATTVVKSRITLIEV